MRGDAVGDLAGDELQAAARRLVVEEDPRAGEEVVGLAVVDRDVVAVDLGHAVGAARVEGRALVLRRLAHLAEHLAGGRLVEADPGSTCADRLEHAGDAQRGELGGQHRLVPRRAARTTGPRGCRPRPARPLQRPPISEGWSSRSAWTNRRRSRRCSMRSYVSVDERRTMPHTS